MLEVINSKIFMTQGVASLMSGDQCFMFFVKKSLNRYCHKDWGDMSEADKKANDWAVENGGRVFAAYKQGSYKIWIIIEADRRATTVLLPEEY